MKGDIAAFKEDSTDEDSTPEEESSSSDHDDEPTAVEHDKKEGAEAAKDNGAVKDDSTAIGHKMEIKEYEGRYSLKGERAVKEKGAKPDADSQDSQYAVRSYKYYQKNGTLEDMTFEIHSPFIQEALHNVVCRYPSQSFSGTTIFLSGNTVEETLACLFHYRKELSEYARKHENLTAKMHILMVVKFVETEFRRAIQRHESFVTLADKPSIGFTDMWMIFKPGDLAYYDARKDADVVVEVVKIVFVDGNTQCPPKWVVTGKSFAHDGKNYGYHDWTFQFDKYEGTREISRLFFHPLKYHAGVDSLREKLILRGRKYCSLTGAQYRAYTGKAWTVGYEKMQTPWGGFKIEYPSEPIQLTGRIMLDCVSFAEHRTDKHVKLADGKTVAPEDITDEDLFIANFRIAGFSLSEKRWCLFFVEHIHDVDFDDDAFEALLLPASQKRLVRALTKQHTLQGSVPNHFDDFIKGKGKGCIFLFHGEPGVGKTFTVESISDSIRRPLYVLMSGDLGFSIESIEKNLTRILRLVTRWKAVLLLDEADVFLEARSSHDLARNGLVSVFLRIMEYFPGIMFLTTNRITSFDLAFQSRIHLAIKYPALDKKQRAELWRMFLKRTSNYDPQKWPEEMLHEFAEMELNGRQIKNSVRTANALALSESNELSAEDIRVVIDTVEKFASDFEKEVHHDLGVSVS